jgi:hypothetical protein
MPGDGSKALKPQAPTRGAAVAGRAGLSAPTRPDTNQPGPAM